MTLEQLLNVSDDFRDQNWENSFFKEFCNSTVKIVSPEPQTGPDGWPYLVVETSFKKGDEVDTTQKIFHWLETRGIGLVVNPQKSYPDFVFTYGMIWHFRKTGLFYSPSEKKYENPTFSSEKDLRMLSAGDPSEEVIPQHVRKVLKNFFTDQGVLLPQWQIVSEDEKNWSIALSLESLGNPPQSEHSGILEAFSWFLPAHYSIMILSSKEISGFVAI